MCGSIALAGREAASPSAQSVGLNADCLGQLCLRRLYALVYSFGCACRAVSNEVEPCCGYEWSDHEWTGLGGITVIGG